MNTIYLSDFHGEDDRERFVAALGVAKKTPGTTVVVEPGTYRITSERARAAQRSVMSGDFGANPQPVMFSPNYVYDVGIDLRGHIGTTIEAAGVFLEIDGFMEDISLRDCNNVTVRGLTVDNKRRPYTKGVITKIKADAFRTTAEVELAEYMPRSAPIMRSGIYSVRLGRFIPDVRRIGDIVSNDGKTALVVVTGDASDAVGDEVYFCHTWHSRPSILIEGSKDILIENVTVHSHAGMGITGFHSENVTLKGFCVVPAPGEHHSTNTDATHFASCRGKLVLDRCRFEGHGDDALNVHTYYYTVVEHALRRVVLEVRAPDGTHTQSVDCPEPGDVMELCRAESLDPVASYRVISAETDAERRVCTVTLDKDLPDDMSAYLLADPDETPDVTVRGCTFRDHYARSLLIKSRRCLIEDCDFSDVFELGVKVAAESSWYEGVNTEEVTIKNCRFINCGRERNICGGIHVYMETLHPRQSHGYVEISDNMIECPECEHGMIIKDVKRALIRGNYVVSRGESVVIGDRVDVCS